jgi:hypothetical protein
MSIFPSRSSGTSSACSDRPAPFAERVDGVREVEDSGSVGNRHRHLLDAMIAVILAMLAGLGAFHGQGRVDPLLLSVDGWDVWFDADPPHVYDNLINRRSDHVRTKDHPLFTLLTYPVVKVIRLVSGYIPSRRFGC